MYIYIHIYTYAVYTYIIRAYTCIIIWIYSKIDK